MSIHQDLKVGKQAEMLVKKMFDSNGITCEINQDTQTREFYDLLCKIGRKKFNCEVKRDVKSEVTGNIAVEYHNSKLDKPSGIYVTKACLWIYVLKDGNNMTIWGTKTETLKSFVKDNKPVRNLKGVGDNNACILLYKDYHLLEIFHRLETLKEEEFKKLIRKILK